MRAPRFQLNLPIQYRPAGAPEWHQGRTLNISRSGVLFRCTPSKAPEEEPALTTEVPVEVKILLSGSPAGVGELSCEGWIVRLETPDEGSLALAVEFSDYEFQQSKSIQ